jgi:hypothetical protein
VIIDRTTVNAVKMALVNSEAPEVVLDDVRQMLEIKRVMLPHADAAVVPGSLLSEKDLLSREIELLDSALNALNNNNVDAALRKLDEYQQYLAAREDGVLPVICEGCMPDKRFI